MIMTPTTQNTIIYFLNKLKTLYYLIKILFLFLLMNELISNTISITKIYHISDIHIRLTERHTEYTEVFTRLYSALSKEKESDLANNIDSILIITGDIYHAHSSSKPDCDRILQDFLFNLQNIMPLIIIPGNHDLLVTNQQKLDLLNPIIFSNTNVSKTFKSDIYSHIWYLNKGGIYRYANIVFSVVDIYSNLVIKASDITLNEGDKLVGLAHLMVNTGEYPTTNITRQCELSDFADYDYVLLGDIHRQSVLQKKKPVIAYAGSLIQQNRGEDVFEHGYLTWNLNKKKAKNVLKYNNIHNDYGFVIFDGNGEVNPTTTSHIPMKPTITIRYNHDTDIEHIHNITKQLKIRYNVQKIITDVLTTTNDKEDESDEHSKQEELNINHLIEEKINKQYKSPTKNNIQKELISYHNKVFAELTEKESYDMAVRQWRIKSLKFRNLIIYGDNIMNEIAFDEFSGIVGLFGENSTGKTSLVDIILFSIWGRCPRGMASEVINVNAKEFMTEVIITTGTAMGTTYKITRNGKKKKNNTKNKLCSVEEKVGLECVAANELIDLVGRDKNSTNQIIEGLFGNYDVFFKTHVMHQSNTDRFIYMSNIERKTFLYKVFNLEMFDKLHTIANEKRKFQKKLMAEKNSSIFDTLDDVYNSYIDLYKLQADCEFNNYCKLLYQNKLDFWKSQSIDISPKELRNIQNELYDLKNKVNFKEIEEKSIDNIKKEMNEIKDRLDYLPTRLNETKDEMTSRVEKLNAKLNKKYQCHFKDLDKLTFGTHCKSCKSNKLLLCNNSDSGSSKIDADLKKKKENEIKILELVIEKYDDISAYFKLQKELEVCEIVTRIHKLQTKLDSCKNNIICENIKQKIISFDSINLGRMYERVNGLEKKYTEIIELDHQIKIGDYYCSLVHTTGLPQEILTDKLKILQSYSNKLLDNLTGNRWNIKMEINSNNLVIYLINSSPLVNGESDNSSGHMRNINTCSWGLEHFAVELAIKHAIQRILYSCNFMVIDESISQIDNVYRLHFKELLIKFKHYYHFILMISHLDVMKECADSNIRICYDKDKISSSIMIES